MAVKIRLMRVGKRKQPSYRVVVADARSPRDGRIIETIGHYGPRNDPSRVEIDGDRALDWLRRGAQPTEQVQKLLTATGVWKTFQSEKGHEIVTKLNRRGYATGRIAPAKEPKSEARAAAAGQPEPAAETETAPAGDTAEPAPVEEAPVAEAPVEDATPEEKPE